jgi:steroid 5-alpha reductase family enzyme
MRQKHGSRFAWVSLLTVFVLQGVIMAIVALPLQTSGCGVVRSTLMASVGGLVWLTGLAFETIGDWQLAAFKKNPENSGQVMDRGLWKYTRHPNYFGDFCVWWGLWLVAMASNAAIWSVVGPVVMSILLMKVSGVTLLEKTLVSSKPGYQQYASRTSAFFPLPVRKS